MKVKFDSLSRLEVPKLYLCNPGSKIVNGMLTNVIGCLSDTTDEEFVLNFNCESELNFRVYRTRREDADENRYIVNLYRSLQNRRLVYAEDIGYFMITNVKDGYSEGKHYKDIRCTSCEAEIRSKAQPGIENKTYAFDDLLDKLIAALPLWTKGHVDTEVSERHRTFEDVATDLNILGFMLENMQDAYECIFVFDCIHRKVNVYDQSNYVKLTNIHLTKDDVINSIDIEEDSENLYTALRIYGPDNLHAGGICPLGESIVYNFDYYLDWMTPDLRQRVEAWKTLMDAQMEPYYNLQLERAELQQRYNDYEAEKARLKIQCSLYENCKDNIVADSADIVSEYNTEIAANGGKKEDEISITDDIEALQKELADKIAITQDSFDDYAELAENTKTALDALDIRIRNITTEVKIQNYFTPVQQEELSNYIFQGEYIDEYTVVTDSMTWQERFAQEKQLYDRGVKQLERASKPTQEFTIDTENFLFAKEFEAWSEQLETGCLINVELDDDDVASLFLCTITVNYYDRALSLTFGNRYSRFDPKALFDGVLGNIKKSANTLSFIKDIIYPIKQGELNVMREALQNSRDLTMRAALAAKNQKFTVDGAGITGRELLDSGEYSQEQVKMVNNRIVFTDDAWDTCKLALGKIIVKNSDGSTTEFYGINAQVIMGDLVVGNQLCIKDEDGNDQFVVMQDKITSTVSENIDKSVDEALDSALGDDSALIQRISKVEQTANDLKLDFSEIIIDENGEILGVKNSMGYTFDVNGLHIQRLGNEINNIINENGMFVKRNDTDVLTADSSGVNALNLTARQYLVVGMNSRFEDYTYEDGTKRTGCFYVGEVNDPLGDSNVEEETGTEGDES